MGTFAFHDNDDLSVEIASKDLGAEIQKITWNRDDRSGTVLLKNKKNIEFTGGTITSEYLPSTDEKINLRFKISENETLDCNIVGPMDFDLNKYCDEINAIRIEYWREADDSSTDVDIITGRCKVNTDNDTLTVNIKTDDQESKIKNINWLKASEKKSGSIIFSDGTIKEFEGGTLYIDDSYTGTNSKLIFEFIDDKESLVFARFLTEYKLPELKHFYDEVPEYLR